jgi:hypothetical protein
MRFFARGFHFDGGAELGLQLVAVWPDGDHVLTSRVLQLEIGFLVWRLIVGVELGA